MCNHKWMTFGADEKGNFRVCSRCGKKVYTITNADRIRAMSDEKLVRMIACCDTCTDICLNEYEKGRISERCNGNCLDRVLKWLQQPAEEGTP